MTTTSGPVFISSCIVFKAKQNATVRLTRVYHVCCFFWFRAAQCCYFCYLKRYKFTNGSFFFLWRRGPTRAMASSFMRFQITHVDAPQSVGLLWISDQLVAETST